MSGVRQHGLTGSNISVSTYHLHPTAHGSKEQVAIALQSLVNCRLTVKATVGSMGANHQCESCIGALANTVADRQTATLLL